MNAYETKIRTVTKTVLWRIIATVITWLSFYIFTHRISESTKITIVAATSGMIAYYYYERLWNHIQWGKVITKDKNESSLDY